MFLLKMQKKRSILGDEGSASLNLMTPPFKGTTFPYDPSFTVFDFYWLRFLIFIGYGF
jgi:hypothetical protein